MCFAISGKGYMTALSIPRLKPPLKRVTTISVDLRINLLITAPSAPNCVKDLRICANSPLMCSSIYLHVQQSASAVTKVLAADLDIKQPLLCFICYIVMGISTAGSQRRNRLYLWVDKSDLAFLIIFGHCVFCVFSCLFHCCYQQSFELIQCLAL